MMSLAYTYYGWCLNGLHYPAHKVGHVCVDCVVSGLRTTTPPADYTHQEIGVTKICNKWTAIVATAAFALSLEVPGT